MYVPERTSQKRVKEQTKKEKEKTFSIKLDKNCRSGSFGRQSFMLVAGTWSKITVYRHLAVMRRLVTVE